MGKNRISIFNAYNKTTYLSSQ